MSKGHLPLIVKGNPIEVGKPLDPKGKITSVTGFTCKSAPIDSTCKLPITCAQNRKKKQRGFDPATSEFKSQCLHH